MPWAQGLVPGTQDGSDGYTIRPWGGHHRPRGHPRHPPRLRIILEHGEGRPFDPYDRFAQREDCAGKRIGEMLDEFAALRAANLAELRSLELNEEQLDRRGVHPALGPVSTRQLISSWVVHDLGHIAQAARVMAKYYRDDAGPWRGHLPVLDR